MSDGVIARMGPFPAPIHPGSKPQKCLGVRGGLSSNGTPVQIFDCNGTPAQDWVIQPGNTQVRLSNTDFCLDAESAPTDDVRIKIRKCIGNNPKFPAQSWLFTTDNHITLFNQDLCLDLPGGNATNGVQVQIRKCLDNNPNQAWVT